MKKDQLEKREIRLVKDSLYRLTSLGTREKSLITSGMFLGFTSIGSDEGICIRMDSSHKELENKVRVIPTHMLLAIDLLEQKAGEDGEGVEEERTAYYLG
ncbi:MAG: hypothetical protein KAT70_07765 [Thermoplasmata archaeon]|nr:hypothetical protein [Thermoplasmata archaeon]